MRKSLIIWMLSIIISILVFVVGVSFSFFLDLKKEIPEGFFPVMGYETKVDAAVAVFLPKDRKTYLESSQKDTLWEIIRFKDTPRGDLEKFREIQKKRGKTLVDYIILSKDHGITGNPGEGPHFLWGHTSIKPVTFWDFVKKISNPISYTEYLLQEDCMTFNEILDISNLLDTSEYKIDTLSLVNDLSIKIDNINTIDKVWQSIESIKGWQTYRLTKYALRKEETQP